MCSTTVTLQPVTMAVKPLTQAASFESWRPVHETGAAKFHPVHMNWMVVTDTKGNRRLQMRWQAN